jgi:Protein of unknown function (DUF3098)
MAKANKPQQKPLAQPVAPKAPVSTRVSRTSDTPSVFGQRNDNLVFGKENYKWMLIGIAIMLVGYLCMAGGGMPDANTWDASVIYSPMRIIVAPFLIMAGLVVEIYAIFKKNTANTEN